GQSARGGMPPEPPVELTPPVAGAPPPAGTPPPPAEPPEAPPPPEAERPPAAETPPDAGPPTPPLPSAPPLPVGWPPSSGSTSLQATPTARLSRSPNGIPGAKAPLLLSKRRCFNFTVSRPASLTAA